LFEDIYKRIEDICNKFQISVLVADIYICALKCKKTA